MNDYPPPSRLLTAEEVAYLDHRLGTYRRLTPHELVDDARRVGRTAPRRYQPSDLRDADYIAAPYYDDDDPRGGMVAALLAVASVLAVGLMLGYIAWRAVGA